MSQRHDSGRWLSRLCPPKYRGGLLCLRAPQCLRFPFAQSSVRRGCSRFVAYVEYSWLKHAGPGKQCGRLGDTNRCHPHPIHRRWHSRRKDHRPLRRHCHHRLEWHQCIPVQPGPFRCSTTAKTHRWIQNQNEPVMDGGLRLNTACHQRVVTVLPPARLRRSGSRFCCGHTGLPGLDVGLDDAGNHVHRRPLCRCDDVDARGTTHLRQSLQATFNLFLGQFHQIGQFIDDADDVGHRLER